MTPASWVLLARLRRQIHRWRDVQIAMAETAIPGRPLCPRVRYDMSWRLLDWAPGARIYNRMLASMSQRERVQALAYARAQADIQPGATT